MGIPSPEAYGGLGSRNYVWCVCVSSMHGWQARYSAFSVCSHWQSLVKAGEGSPCILNWNQAGAATTAAAVLGDHHVREEAEPEAISFKARTEETLTCAITPGQRTTPGGFLTNKGHRRPSEWRLFSTCNSQEKCRKRQCLFTTSFEDIVPEGNRIRPWPPLTGACEAAYANFLDPASRMV